MALSVAILALASVAAGALVGVFYGFCAAGRASTTSGSSITTHNRLIRLLTQENISLSFGQAFAMLTFLGLSLVLFFGAFMVPAALAGTLGLEGWFVPLSYGVLFLAAFVGWQFGGHLWKVVA
jgi:hypothetical protein